MAEYIVSELAQAEPKRVLVVSSMYPTVANPVGGIFIHEQVKALRARGVDARVVTGQALWLSARRPARAVLTYLRALSQMSGEWDAYDGVPVCRFIFPAGAFSRRSNYPYFYAYSLKRVLGALRHDFDYQIVHGHTAYLDGRAAAMAARVAGVPYVLTEHTGPFSTVTDDWSMRVHTQAGVDAADSVIAVSAALKDAICASLKDVSPARISVIPNGIDTSFFDPVVLGNALDVLQDGQQIRYAERLVDRLREQVGNTITADMVWTLTEGALRDVLLEVRRPLHDAGSASDFVKTINAIWVGHHVDVKRVDRLLDAFAIAHRRYAGLRLTLVGDGPLKAEHERRAEALGVAPYVTFQGARSRVGVKFEVREADFLVISSEVETFGVVAIEALAMGKPVLATACGGPQDILDDPQLGILVPNTMEDLAIGIQRMVGQIGEFNAQDIRKRAISRFDFGSVTERLASEYARVSGRCMGQSTT